MPFNDVFIMQMFNELKKTKYKIWALKLLCLKENWMYLRTESWFWSFHEGYEWNNRCAQFCMAGVSISNKTSIIYCSLCNFSVFRPSSRAQGLLEKFKRTMRYWPIIVPTDTESVSLFERIAAENKYLRKGRENKQMIDVMTGRFYIVIFIYLFFFSRNGSTAVSIKHSRLDLKAGAQNKGVVRRLFGSILIS